MTEASDDLLFVELIGFELHAPHGLHDAVILQALLPGQRRLHRRSLLQAVHVAFLLARTARRKKNKNIIIIIIIIIIRLMDVLQSGWLFSFFLIFVSAHLNVKGRLRGEVGEGAGDHDSGALVTKHTHTSDVGHSKNTHSSQSLTNNEP